MGYCKVRNTMMLTGSDICNTLIKAPSAYYSGTWTHRVNRASGTVGILTMLLPSPYFIMRVQPAHPDPNQDKAYSSLLSY